LSIQRQFERVNKELWLVLSLFLIAALINFAVSAERMVLAFYTLPTVFSAYLYGRRHATLLEPVGGSLRRILPIILSHHDKFDGSGYHPTHGEDIPLEARIIAVADVFASLTSDRPYRKAMSPFEVREILTNGAGTEFDPKVVEAFLAAFKKGEMEVPSLLV
jgi:hypothetical protein